MATSTDCWPWWHETFSILKAAAWTKAVVPTGCSNDYTGNVPCAPASMRATSEAWLSKNAPQALEMLGGSLSQDIYTFARYMHSEVGSGTIEERVAVGEAGLNQAKRRAGTFGDWRAKLNVMLLPNGKYGAIHAPEAYCSSIGKPPKCNAANRWAATSLDPSILSILLANLVLSGQSRNFANGALTQWGPDAGWLNLRTPERIGSFVLAAAYSDRYYWVGPLPGVDPWHTWLTFKGPAYNTEEGRALIRRGIEALPLNENGSPRRMVWRNLPACSGGSALLGGLSGAELALTVLGLAAGAYGAIRFNRWIGHSHSV